MAASDAPQAPRASQPALAPASCGSATAAALAPATCGSAAAAAREQHITRRKFLALGVSTVAAAAAFGLAGCSASTTTSSTSTAPAQQTMTFFALDTLITITAVAETSLLEAAQTEVARYENLFSRTIEGTDVWNINHANGTPVEVHEDTADLIRASLAISEESGGLFDASIGSVSTLWDFTAGVKPDDDQIAQAVAHVDYRNIAVEGTTVTLADPEAQLDLGGIAKGYIGDALVRLLSEGGCTSACVDIGGNLCFVGGKPDGTPWNAGVVDPNDSDSSVVATIACADGTLVTSGLYERSFVADGTLYYHILDPRTGYPAQTDLVAVSVRGADSTTADAYATLLFMLGRDGALDFLAAHPDLSALLIDTAGGITCTPDSAFQLV